jgi:hypothetical protein
MDETTTAILDSELPSALQVTLLELHRRTEGGLYVGTQEEIARARGVTRGTVSSQLKSLRDIGWIEKVGSALRIVVDESERTQSTQCRDSQQTVDSFNTEKGFPLGSLRFSPKKVHSTPISPSLLTPSQTSLEPPSASPTPWLRPSDRWESVSEPLPDNHPARWEHLPGEWTFDFALAALEHLRELDLLATPTRKKIDREGEQRVAAQWADTFRLLKEQDGYERAEIKDTMEWLFDGGNFWVEKQAIRSVPPLRSKTGSGDAYKFDVMFQQAQSESNGADRPEAKQRPDENWERIARAAEAA